MKIEQQFANCVRQYERLIITICLSFTQNYFDAEDLAQETFLAAYRSWGSFDGSNLKGWLCTIAANKCRDYLKSPARRNKSLAEEDYADIMDSGPQPHEGVEQSETAERLKSLCARLKEPYRTVAEGYFCEQKKLSELAKETGTGIKTLQTQLYRSKKLLRALWEEDAG